MADLLRLAAEFSDASDARRHEIAEEVRRLEAELGQRQAIFNHSPDDPS